MIFLLKEVIFRFYVSFGGCNFSGAFLFWKKWGKNQFDGKESSNDSQRRLPGFSTHQAHQRPLFQATASGASMQESTWKSSVKIKIWPPAPFKNSTKKERQETVKLIKSWEVSNMNQCFMLAFLFQSHVGWQGVYIIYIYITFID